MNTAAEGDLGKWVNKEGEGRGKRRDGREVNGIKREVKETMR